VSYLYEPPPYLSLHTCSTYNSVSIGLHICTMYFECILSAYLVGLFQPVGVLLWGQHIIQYQHPAIIKHRDFVCRACTTCMQDERQGNCHLWPILSLRLT
jgi:hypothetical protein